MAATCKVFTGIDYTLRILEKEGERRELRSFSNTGVITFIMILFTII